MFERHRQAVSRIRDQDLSVDPTLQLMVEGTNAEFALQAFEWRLDLRQLYVTVKLWRVTSCPAGGSLIFTKPNAQPASVLAEPTRICNWSRSGQLRRMARSFGKSLKPNKWTALVIGLSFVARKARPITNRPQVYNLPHSEKRLNGVFQRCPANRSESGSRGVCFVALRQAP
jgi:hypothetical protein